MQLDERVTQIEARNARVERDKAWETSFTRIVAIAVLTYIVIVLFFVVAELPKPYLNPIVPTVGFVLSTLTLPFVRKIWEKTHE